MKQYLDALGQIMDGGHDKGDRTGTGTRSVFGMQMRFDCSGPNLPVVTTKKLFLRGVIHELLWIISGSTNIKYLVDNDVHIWDEWADKNGDLGPVYGKQWRKWEGQIDRVAINEQPDPGEPPILLGYKQIDQLKDVIERIKTNPDCRRLIVTAWNPPDIESATLPPCHCFFQFWVCDGRISLQIYQRSCDMFLGVPFNIFSYSLLLRMVAQVTGLLPGDFIWTGGDCHIYKNHFKQVELQLERTPMGGPAICLNPEVRNIDDFTFSDIDVVGYKSHPAIKAPVSV
jgi:thymidylate synthase